MTNTSGGESSNELRLNFNECMPLCLADLGSDVDDTDGSATVFETVSGTPDSSILLTSHPLQRL